MSIETYVVQYQVAYAYNTNYVINNVTVDFTNNLHPCDDEATITIAGIINNINTIPLLAARQIWIYRSDNQGNTVLMWRGMTTNISYSLQASGGTTTINCQGLWHLLEIRYLSIGGYTPPGYPTNPYLIYLNPVLQLKVGGLWELILYMGFTNYYGVGQMTTILPDLTAFDDDPLGGIQYAVGSASVSTTNVTGMGTSWLSVGITAGNRIGFGNTNPSLIPTDMWYNISLVNSDTSITLTSSAGVIPNGPYVIQINTSLADVIVNDTMNMQYATIAQAIDKIVQGAFPPTVGGGNVDTGVVEVFLNKEADPPTLSLKAFDPADGYYGIGENKADPSSDEFIEFLEGENIESIELTRDYENMANSVLFTGAQFAGAELLVVPLENKASIDKFGLKQTSKTAGGSVDADEINRFANKLVPMIQTPIQTFELTPVNTFVATEGYRVDPGDQIHIVSPSIFPVLDPTPTYSATGEFDARVRIIHRTWSVDGGENMVITLSFPVNLTPQYSSMYAKPTIDTLVGNLQNTVQQALINRENQPIEHFQTSVSFTIQDIVLNDKSIMPAFFHYPIDMNAMLKPYAVTNNNGTTNSNLLSQTQNWYIEGIWLTVNGQNVNTNINSPDDGIPKIHLRLKQPDAFVVWDADINLGEKYNLFPAVVQQTDSDGILLSKLSGTYIASLSNWSVENTQIGDNETYVATFEISFVRGVGTQSTPTAASGTLNTTPTIVATRGYEPTLRGLSPWVSPT